MWPVIVITAVVQLVWRGELVAVAAWAYRSAGGRGGRQRGRCCVGHRHQSDHSEQWRAQDRAHQVQRPACFLCKFHRVRLLCECHEAGDERIDGRAARPSRKLLSAKRLGYSFFFAVFRILGIRVFQSAGRPGRELGTRIQVQLVPRMLDMVLNRAHSAMQPQGDLLARHAL